jgi:hypothetical protein
MFMSKREEFLYLTLKEIVKGEGRFSLDHLEHAKNTIENMQELAQEGIDLMERKPND